MDPDVRLDSSLPALLAALLLGSCGSSSDPAPLPATLKVPVVNSPQRGPSDAWVTVVEFGDFQCPFCRDAEPAVAAIVADHPGDVRLVWKQLPLTSIHPNAQAAALAAECAFSQGKFWEMHDLLLTTGLDAGSVLQDARQVPDLDVPAWQACITGPEAASSVASDVTLALQLGVPGTPTFVVNGYPIFGAKEADLRAAIDRARSAAMASGIARVDYYDMAVLGAK